MPMSTAVHNSTMADHFDHLEMAEETHSHNGSSKRRSKKHQQQETSSSKPKGILKNSNPNATYHKHHHRRRLEELVEHEIIPTHTHHGRHRHHHDHHKHHRIDPDSEENEKNRRNKHHSHRDSSLKKKHKHSKHSGGSDTTTSEPIEYHDNSSKKADQFEGVTAGHEDDNIYDRPNVPPIPVVISNPQPDNSSSKNYEAPQNRIISTTEEAVYDVPRSNPRKVEREQKEAIYVNNSFAASEEDHLTTTITYDVPRSVSNRWPTLIP